MSWPENSRTGYHCHVATLMEERFPETVETHPELLAHHYEEAGLAKQAVEYWYLAGERVDAVTARVFPLLSIRFPDIRN